MPLGATRAAADCKHIGDCHVGSVVLDKAKKGLSKLYQSSLTGGLLLFAQAIVPNIIFTVRLLVSICFHPLFIIGHRARRSRGVHALVFFSFSSAFFNESLGRRRRES